MGGWGRIVLYSIIYLRTVDYTAKLYKYTYINNIIIYK